MIGHGIGVTFNTKSASTLVVTPWVNSIDTSVAASPLGFNLSRITRTGGTGIYVAFAKTTAALTGNFTLYGRLTSPAGGGLLLGLNGAPNNTTTSIDRLIELNGTGTLTSYETGLTAAQSHGTWVATDYLVFQRVGSTLSLYKSADGVAFGTALRTWTDTNPYFGEVSLSVTGAFSDVKMIS